MRKIMLAGFAAAALASMPANAAVTVECPGGSIIHGCSFDDENGSGSFYNRVVKQPGQATSFNDVFLVTLASAGDLTVTLTNTPSGMTFTDLLFDGEAFTIGTVGTTFTRGPGTYELRLSGSTTQTASYSGTLDFSAAVPEPGTWALLLAGFGMVGYSMRRRNQAFPQIA